LDLGDGVVFQFTNVSGWNNTDGVGPDQVQALTGDHFFTAGPQGADDPAAFSLTGLAATDIVILEFIDRRGGETALVTFEGVTTLVSSDAESEFTDVSSGGVTGQTVYAGAFTGPGGSGEGNLAGARITIIRNDGGGAPCPADFNQDGVVNGADFGALLSAWGKCGKCPEDLDGDGAVGGSDIGALLSAWGDCPGGGGPTGACCLGEACWSIGEADCATLGGQYSGDGTSCDDVTCEPPTKGSCCEAGVVPGCIDPQCSSAVCLVSPDCCSILWDADCAGLALDICNDCDGTTDFSRYAIDFGQATGCTSPLFTGTFDGSSDFIAMTLSDCGVVESPTLDLGGGVTFGFVNVSGWNNTDGFPANEVPALTGDHFFSSALGADDPVAFSVDGLDPGDLLILEFLDRRGSETALVTFEGVQTLVNLEAEGRFTDVSGGGVTGKSSYSGSFTGADGVGEGNLSGARITIIRSGGGTEGACCLGDSCSSLDAILCQALGGEYQGDGTDCGSVDCEPVGFGPCCEAGEIPGCIDLTCSYVVCLTMPECCDVLWDADCAAMAITECNDCDGTTDTKVSAIDFGQSPGAADGCNGPSPLYSGAFDGIDGFVAMDMSDCGVIESPSIDLGSGLTLSFTNVSGWNNTDGVGPESTQALTGDHFFSSALEADDPVQFSITGANPCTTIILEFADRRGNEVALVTFEGTTTLVDAVPDTGGAFTDVSGGGVTGKSSYTGSFTGRDGSGEGNLAGARITVIPGDPDCDSGLCDGGIGDCGSPQSGPGCGCDDCEALVCGIDPICCSVVWDEFCAGIAQSQCGP
ncbi:MAG: hypothetical protein VX672_04805, partial [Planctomycetota bacterium]|nr:hypothetical protein [Planctomycetota bacterium]